ncbi:MAG TPA: hypothetical protein VIH83_06145 [Candidatus Bathyarchaeia archaeon]
MKERPDFTELATLAFDTWHSAVLGHDIVSPVRVIARLCPRELMQGSRLTVLK